MSENSAIEWTHHTFNPWSGCTKVSAGCAHCYAAALPPRMRRGASWGVGEPRVLASDAYWRQPERWNRAAEKAGERRRVFCASTADVFEDRADLDPARDRLFELIEQTPALDWLLLTKRAHVLPRYAEHFARLPNTWAGISVEDQRAADERIPWLLQVPARIRFLSCEPLLGPVTLWTEDGTDPNILHGPAIVSDGTPPSTVGGIAMDAEFHTWPGIEWVIVGGESGRRARPMHPAWARSLRDQCQVAGVPFFFKQWGEWGRHGSVDCWSKIQPDGSRSRHYPDSPGIAWLTDGRICMQDFSEAEHRARVQARVATSHRAVEVDRAALADVDRTWKRGDQEALRRLGYEWMYRMGKHAAGRLLDGRTWDEMPRPPRAVTLPT